MGRKGVNEHEEDQCNHSSTGSGCGFCFYRMPEAGSSEVQGRVGNNDHDRCTSVDHDNDNNHDHTRNKVVSGTIITKGPPACPEGFFSSLPVQLW
jgi:hypothetical protein